MRKPIALLLVVAACDDAPTAPDRDAASTADATASDDDAGGSIDAASPRPPTWSSEMTSADADAFYIRTQPEGAVDLGVADPGADDGLAARLRFPGIPELGNADRVGPAFASELGTDVDTFHFGTYRVRARLAACAAGEEVVNGLFTYFNDGEDHDADGIVDNAEIDLELLCGTPAVLFLTVWTDYSFATETFRKHTRAIDLATGDLWDSPSDREYGLVLAGNDPALARPELLDPDTYVELGFEWLADRVRYFAVIDGVEQTIWELTGATAIPQLPGAILANVWHPGDHWFGGGAPPDYPAADATLHVDWVRYWQEGTSGSETRRCCSRGGGAS